MEWLTDYLVGTGGWAYFNAPGELRLKAYAEVFNFVEVNYTFYEYPDVRKVEHWRRVVPEDFTFAVLTAAAQTDYYQSFSERRRTRPTAQLLLLLNRS